MIRDRDRILEQALKHELGAAATPPADSCLDAETLGAWTDGGLKPAVMAAMEAHVSSCARCQALVGAMARSTVRTPSTVRTLSLWKWWLAPIAAGVTAVTLWMVVPEQQKLATAPPQPEVANLPQTPAPAQPLPPAAPATDAERPTDQFAQRDNTVATAARENRRRDKPSEERKEEAAPLQERAKLADTAVPSTAAAPPAPAAATLRAPAEFGALAKSARRIVAPAGIDVTHQSAPSDSVCWFVGRAGLVLLTTDGGATFARVDLAEPLDLASVSATDARIAIITTTGGLRFRTDDGGRTWRPL